jgi:hypothetical protein
MRVVDKQVDGLSVLAVLNPIVPRYTCSLLSLLPPSPHVLIKFHQKQRLILNIGKEAIISDQIEYSRFAQTKVVRNRFSGLLVHQMKSD